MKKKFALNNLIYSEQSQSSTSPQDEQEHVDNLQSRTKFIKQCQEIKQNWTGSENFEICFSIIFDN